MTANSLDQRAWVLIVDDNPADVDLLKAAFRRAGLQVDFLVAQHGLDALQLVRREAQHLLTRPGIILLDLQLPTMDGMELLGELKTDDVLKSIPVIVFTSSTAAAEVRMAYAEHANAVVTKPADYQQLVHIVSSIHQFWLSVAKLPNDRFGARETASHPDAATAGPVFDARLRRPQLAAALPSEIDVLLVEDCEADAVLVERSLSQASSALFSLTRVDRLQDALARAEVDEPDVVLLDLHLPDSAGMHTLTTIRAALPELPVIVLTGTDDDSVALQALLNGAQDYCPKSLVPHGILPRVVRYAIERQRMATELTGYATAVEVANDSLRRLHRRAEAATRTKSEFLANMSHEIRTPMTAIMGYADVLADQLDQPEELQAVQTIKRNGSYLLELLNDILDISKVEAGRLSIEKTPCSPAQLVAEVFELMQPRARASALQLSTEFVGPIPERIDTDPTRLRQVLVNLVGNAIKFTQRGRVCVRTQMVHDPAGLSRLRIDVVDTGIGINHEQRRRLFRPFSQADMTTTRRFGGTGLGLTICKRLVEMLGGEIQVASEPGAGSTFTVLIDPGPLEGVMMRHDPPLLDCELAAPAAPASPASPVAARPQLDCRILLAEDGRDNQRLISCVLEKAGARVTVVDNGQLAVDAALQALAQRRPFDLILMDIQMPLVDGYTATRRLRQAGYPYFIMALTAHAMSGEREKCLQAGCDDFATKPIVRRILLQKIGRLIRSAPRRDENVIAPLD